MLQLLRTELAHYISSTGRDNAVIVQNLVDCLLEKYRVTSDHQDWTRKAYQAYHVVLGFFQSSWGSQWVQKQVTRALMENKTNVRFNLDAVDFLVTMQLVNLVSYDIHLVQYLFDASNPNFHIVCARV